MCVYMFVCLYFHLTAKQRSVKLCWNSKFSSSALSHLNLSTRTDGVRLQSPLVFFFLRQQHWKSSSQHDRWTPDEPQSCRESCSPTGACLRRCLLVSLEEFLVFFGRLTSLILHQLSGHDARKRFKLLCVSCDCVTPSSPSLHLPPPTV